MKHVCFETTEVHWATYHVPFFGGIAFSWWHDIGKFADFHSGLGLFHRRWFVRLKFLDGAFGIVRTAETKVLSRQNPQVTMDILSNVMHYTLCLRRAQCCYHDNNVVQSSHLQFVCIYFHSALIAKLFLSVVWPKVPTSPFMSYKRSAVEGSKAFIPNYEPSYLLCPKNVDSLKVSSFNSNFPVNRFNLKRYPGKFEIGDILKTPDPRGGIQGPTVCHNVYPL